MDQSRRYEQHQRQWRDQPDARLTGNERRGEDHNWEWGADRSAHGMDGGYRGGQRQAGMADGFDSDRWMDSPRPIGDRDSSRSWRGTGAGSYEGGDNYERYGSGRSTQRSASQGGGFDGGPSEWGGSYAGSREDYSGRGPRGFQRSDERIREQVCERLTDDGAIDASDIEIQVKNGEVTLTGTVRDRQQKRRAEDLVESCAGVSDVTNNIRVAKSMQGRDSQSAGQSQSSQRMGQSGSQNQKTNGKGSNADQSM